MKRTVVSCLAALSAIAATVLFLYAFPRWVPALYFLALTLYAVAVGALTRLFVSSKPLLKALIAAVAYAAGFFAVVFLVNNVILHAHDSETAAVILAFINLAFFAVYYRILSRGQQRRRAFAAGAFGLSALFAVGYAAEDAVPAEPHTKCRPEEELIQRY